MENIISAKTISHIKTKMITGDVKRIADKANMHRTSVTQLLNSPIDVLATENRIKIIEVAMKIIEVRKIKLHKTQKLCR